MGGPFTCQLCGKRFTVPQRALAKYPGWTPRTCRHCRNAINGASRTHAELGTGSRLQVRSADHSPILEESLAKHHEGPKTGLFTDGSARPNPGPGGWGAVYVVDDKVIEQRRGHEPHTTNNRMELIALIQGYKMVPSGVRIDVYTDSELCFKTLTKWAAGWKARGWRRKTGAIKNLELVQALYDLYLARPELTLHWTRSHSGSRWNEYADSLATAWARDEL